MHVFASNGNKRMIFKLEMELQRHKHIFFNYQSFKF